MTFPASSLSRKFWLSALLAALALHGCATSDDVETKHHRPDTNSSRFEWAVQHYEAGNFDKAIQSFEKLRKEGASLPDYDLLPFYLGMSHYKLGHFEPAARELENFVRASVGARVANDTPSMAAGAGVRQEAQEARVTLLLAYEKLGRWKDVSALAMETDKLTLFQYNRALLKLVWARSLREQGELLGAKSALDEAEPFLDKAGGEDGVQPFYADPDQDLWGRFHYTAILVQESECNRLSPHEVEGPKAKAKKKRKAAALKRLYAPWLDAVTDCQRKAVNRAADELFHRDSPWNAPALAALTEGISSVGDHTVAYLKDETASLDRHRALEKAARENFYRLLGTIEDKLNNFKNRELNSDPLESLRKQVDRLLVRISSP